MSHRSHPFAVGLPLSVLSAAALGVLSAWSAPAPRVCQSPDCLRVENVHSDKGQVRSIGVFDTRLHLYVFVPRGMTGFDLGVFDQTDDAAAAKPPQFTLYAPNGSEAMRLDRPRPNAWSDYHVSAGSRWGVWRLSVTGPEDLPAETGKPRPEKAINRFMVRTVGDVDLYLKPEPVARVRGLRLDKPHFGGSAAHHFTVQVPGGERIRFNLLRPRALDPARVQWEPKTTAARPTLRWFTLEGDDRLARDVAFSTLDIAAKNLSGLWTFAVAGVPGVYGIGSEQELRLFFHDAPRMSLPRPTPIRTQTAAGEPVAARLEITSPQTKNERYLTFTGGDGRATLYLLPGVAYRATVSRGYEYTPQTIVLAAASGTNRTVTLPRRFARLPGWYGGDAHMHTTYYDGTHTPAQMVEAARGAGLDWMVLTEHGHSAAIPRVERALAEALPLSQPGRFVVIPGMEYTGPTFHANLLGGTARIPAGADLARVIAAATERNRPDRPVTVALNHPSLGKTAPDIARRAEDLPLIELWNSAEPQATRIWWDRLDRGLRTFAETSSDSHNRQNAPPGYRRTYVFLGDKPLTAANIIDALRAGHSFLSRGALLDFTVNGARPGETSSEPSLAVRVAASSAVPIGHVDIVHNGKIVHRFTANGGGTFAGTLRLPAAPGWYLAQVWGTNESDMPRAMSNPVFLEENKKP